ncbi:hypothetical protein IJX73_02520 [bacterium]|nr:hypothetical protein [bacterium]
MIKEAINKLINEEDLTFIEIREVFDEILSGLANEAQISSFLTALKSKKITTDELLGAIVSSRDSFKFQQFGLNFSDGLESIAFDDKNEYIDILLAIDLICSANNLSVSRYDFNSFSNKNKSFEILKTLGVNLEKNIDFLSNDFEKLNFSYFYLSQDIPYFKYSEKIRNTLPFDNILNITSKMLNPLKTKNLFLGICDKNLVETYANIALRLENNNSIIVCNDNIPFVSLSGESIVAEAWKNKIFTYVITPDLLGFKENDINELKCSDIRENANSLLNIMDNKLKNSMYDFIVLNSALALYISKKSDSIMEGIELAKKTIDTGKMKEKFLQIKNFYL